MIASSISVSFMSPEETRNYSDSLSVRKIVGRRYEVVDPLAALVYPLEIVGVGTSNA